MPGPLTGIRIIEFSGVGPGPFCGMMLADHGAEVICIDKLGPPLLPVDPLRRSKRSIAIDIKKPEGAELARKLVRQADGLIEGFRPGAMEKLGLGPDLLLADTPNLVYGRMTGWGQTGPLAQSAGHDINYIALSGALASCGRAGEAPTPPVNYLGDFGGGGMMLAFGMVSALLAVKNGAPGQVVDCAMTDGSALLTTLIWGLRASGIWKDERGVNLIDTGSHFYDVYETKDGKWISIGAIEPQFYAELRDKLGLANDPAFDEQNNPAAWSLLKEKLKTIFKQKTRDEWSEILEGSDACFAPVLPFEEALNHPHNAARHTFMDIDGVAQPAPAPRYSMTKTNTPSKGAPVGGDTDDVLTRLGYDAAAIAALREGGVVG